MIPKNKPGRSKAYLEFIRTQPCCVCSDKPAEPHHAAKAGIGMKSSDFSTIPLCRRHHRELHDMGIDTFQREKIINIYRVGFKYTIAWLDLHCAEGMKKC